MSCCVALACLPHAACGTEIAPGYLKSSTALATRPLASRGWGEGTANRGQGAWLVENANVIAEMSTLQQTACYMQHSPCRMQQLTSKFNLLASGSFTVPHKNTCTHIENTHTYLYIYICINKSVALSACGNITHATKIEAGRDEARQTQTKVHLKSPQ